MIAQRVDAGGGATASPHSPAPPPADAWKRAHHLLVIGEVAQAIPLMERVVAEYPSWAGARAGLGVACTRMGRIHEAQDLIEGALAEAPTDFSCRMAQAEFFARLGFYDKSIPHLDVALERAPGDPEYRAAFEMRRFCVDKSKGLFYRQTASPWPSNWRLFGRRKQTTETASVAALEKDIA